MRLLLDTHALIWWMLDVSSLSGTARAAIEDPENEVYVSPISAFEIATKVRLGKLAEAALLATNFEEDVARARFKELPVVHRHAKMAGGFRFDHKDPFDRLLLAQAMTESMTLVSKDERFREIAVLLLW